MNTHPQEQSSQKLTIVIPACNEEQTIGEVVRDVHSRYHTFVKEVLVVNDGSTDNTPVIAEKNGARVISHSRNLGYGAALKTGIRTATTEYILTMDADGQHNPDDVIHLWEKAEQNDMVVGQRTALLHSPLWRMPGKWLLWMVANYLSRQKIPDLNSGLRLISKKTALKYLHVCPDGFSFTTTITLVMLCRGYQVKYVPITVYPRTGKSLVSVATGFSTLLTIFRIASLLDPLRIFLPASFAIGVSGVFWGLPYLLGGHGLSVGSMFALLTSVMLFGMGLICDQVSQARLERFE